MMDRAKDILIFNIEQQSLHLRSGTNLSNLSILGSQPKLSQISDRMNFIEINNNK